MSADIAERLSNLEKLAEQIANQSSDNGNSVVGSRLNVEGGTFSYFEEPDMGSPIVMTKSELGRLQQRRRRSRLPQGYARQFKSMSHFLRSGYRNEGEFQKLYKSSIDQLVKANAHNTLDNDSLGFLVLPEFAPDISEIMHNEFDLLGMTDQYTISGNRMAFPRVDESSRADGSRNGGVQGAWLDEGDLMSPTRARMQATEVRLNKLAVVVFLTEELLDDNSYALEQWITKAVRREIQFMVNDAIMNGATGGRPLGFLQSPGTVFVPQDGVQAAGTVSAQNILQMYSRRRPSTPLQDLVWLINQNVEPQLQSMVMPAAGIQSVVYLPPGQLSATPYATLMGIPVKSTEFNPQLGKSGDISLVDMKGYVTISKGGVNEQTSQHVEFLRDQVAIKFTMRIGGRPMHPTPTTPKNSNGADFQGDFITLVDR